MENSLLRISITNYGDDSRICRVIKKARKGEHIVIGVIGGSITVGGNASKYENSYAQLITKWWRAAFPQSRFELINAGLGASGSYIGASRLQRDLLRKKPDFVVIEFSVNDYERTLLNLETTEGLLRQILDDPNKPGIVMMHTFRKDGSSSEDILSPIGKYYDIPMISMKSALYPLILSGRASWADFSKDDVHPNDRGHAYMAHCLTRFLYDLSLRAGNCKSISPLLPPPLISDEFQYAKIFNADSIRPVEAKNIREEFVLIDPTYERLGRAWTLLGRDSELLFRVKGESIGILGLRLPNNDLGRVSIHLDGNPPIFLNEENQESYAWPPYVIIGRKLDGKEHVVRIRNLGRKKSIILAIMTSERPVSSSKTAMLKE
ncbi:MAG TPA: SGNH/GDSL hydrolase family protein [Thermodesulfovibrionales bacterium]|nr:SGNH/GDSL hydrolase family protein [Thermodesulfovibrionales bacterium]